MRTYSHSLGFNGDTWLVIEVTETSGPLEEIFRRVLDLDGTEENSVLLWRLPDGADWDDLPNPAARA